jgi:hypothetical protein
MKQIFFIFSTCIAVFSMTSCQKNTGDSTVNLGSNDPFSLLDLNKLNNMDVKALFTITNSGRATQVYQEGQEFNRDNIQISARTTQNLDSYEATLGNYSLKIADSRKEAPNVLNCDPKDSRNESLFGKKVNITAGKITGYINVPQKIKLLAPVPAIYDKNPFTGSPVDRNAGIQLKWNADASNQRGVILKITCSESVTGGAFISADILQDNGSFYLSSAALKDIPSNKPFEIELIRGNYHVSDSKEELLMCLTSVVSSYNIR